MRLILVLAFAVAVALMPSRRPAPKGAPRSRPRPIGRREFIPGGPVIYSPPPVAKAKRPKPSPAAPEGRRKIHARRQICFGEVDNDGDVFPKGDEITVLGLPVRTMPPEEEKRLFGNVGEGEPVVVLGGPDSYLSDAVVVVDTEEELLRLMESLDASAYRVVDRDDILRGVARLELALDLAGRTEDP